MNRFIDKHTRKITGTIACFDRILFKGYLPISWAESMENFMANKGLLLKDFKRFVTKQSEQIKRHVKVMAEKSGRPYIHINGSVRKEEHARHIAARDGISQGLVCVIAAVKACQSFKLAYRKNPPRLVSARRKCLCLYFYFFHHEFGFMHVRIPTWFPFTIQIYLNGNEWLARKMDDVLSKKYAGLKLSELYYKHSWELVSILLADDELREATALVLIEIMREIQSAIEGGTMAITSTQLDEIRTLIEKIASPACPELRGILVQLMTELNDGQLLNLVCIGNNVSSN